MDKSYYDIEKGLKSKTQMRKQFIQEGYDKSDIDAFLNKQKAVQLTMKKPHRAFHKIIGEPYSFQCDLLFYIDEKVYNHGYIGMLLCLELTSRKLFAYPIKNKNNSTMLDVLSQFIKDAKHITNITTDEGKEFNSKEIRNLFKNNNIIHWIKEINDRTSLGKIDRVCRTLRDLISRYQEAYETKNWVDVIDKLVKNYNNREHRSLEGRTPNEVYNNTKEQEIIRENEQMQGITAIVNMKNYNIGDKVRYLIYKNKFDKGENRWSKTIHTITDIKKFSYFLDNNDDRSFRQHELMKVDNDVQENPFLTKPKKKVNYLHDKKLRKANRITIKELDAIVKQNKIFPNKYLKPKSKKRQIKTIKKYNPRTGKSFIL